MKKLLLLLALFSSTHLSSILAMGEAVLDQAQLDHQLFESIDQPEVVLDLILRGANANTEKAVYAVIYEGDHMLLFGLTPLILASQKGCLETCRHLVNNGAEVNAQSSLTHPPVYYPVRDIKGLTPLFWANHNGHVEVCEFLLNFSKLNDLDDMSDTFQQD